MRLEKWLFLQMAKRLHILIQFLNGPCYVIGQVVVSTLDKISFNKNQTDFTRNELSIWESQKECSAKMRFLSPDSVQDPIKTNISINFYIQFAESAFKVHALIFKRPVFILLDPNEINSNGTGLLSEKMSQMNLILRDCQN